PNRDVQHNDRPFWHGFLSELPGGPSRSTPPSPLLEGRWRRCPSRLRRSAKCPARRIPESRRCLRGWRRPRCSEPDLSLIEPIGTFLLFRRRLERLSLQSGPRQVESESASRNSKRAVGI